MLIRPDRCEACRFVLWDIVGKQFFCRRLPPVPAPIFANTPQGLQQVGLVANFPAVNADWYCGEWKPKPEAAN